MAAVLAGGIVSGIIALGQEISSRIDACATGKRSARAMKARVDRLTAALEAKQKDGRFINSNVETAMKSLGEEFKAVEKTLEWWEKLGSVSRFFNCKDFALALDKSHEAISQLEMELSLTSQDAIAQRLDDRQARMEMMLADVADAFRESQQHQAQETEETRKQMQAQHDAILAAIKKLHEASPEAKREMWETSVTAISPSEIQITDGQPGEQLQSGPGIREGTWRGRRVALKLCSGLNDFQVRELRKEVVRTAPLRHPNIITIYGYCEDKAEGKEYAAIVMELLPRENTLFAQLHATEKLPWMIRMELAAQLADAVAYLHRREIFHCGLKSSNAMLTEDGQRIKLIEFGAAHTASTLSRATREGTARAYTWNWTPKELLDDGRQPAPAVDVYSLCAMLSELITGHPPYAELSAVAVCNAIRDGALPDLTPERGLPGLTSSSAKSITLFTAVVRKGLDREPQRRMTAEELAKALPAIVAEAWGEFADAISADPSRALAYRGLTLDRQYCLDRKAVHCLRSPEGCIELARALPDQVSTVTVNGSNFSKQKLLLHAQRLTEGRHAKAWALLGLLCGPQNPTIPYGENEALDAAECYRRALECGLDEEGSDDEVARFRVWYHLGIALAETSGRTVTVNGEQVGEEACYRKTLELRPTFTEAWLKYSRVVLSRQAATGVAQVLQGEGEQHEGSMTLSHRLSQPITQQDLDNGQILTLLEVVDALEQVVGLCKHLANDRDPQNRLRWDPSQLLKPDNILMLPKPANSPGASRFAPKCLPTKLRPCGPGTIDESFYIKAIAELYCWSLFNCTVDQFSTTGTASFRSLYLSPRFDKWGSNVTHGLKTLLLKCGPQPQGPGRSLEAFHAEVKGLTATAWFDYGYALHKGQQPTGHPNGQPQDFFLEAAKFPEHCDAFVWLTLGRKPDQDLEDDENVEFPPPGTNQPAAPPELSLLDGSKVSELERYTRALKCHSHKPRFLEPAKNPEVWLKLGRHLGLNGIQQYTWKVGESPIGPTECFQKCLQLCSSVDPSAEEMNLCSRAFFGLAQVAKASGQQQQVSVGPGIVLPWVKCVEKSVQLDPAYPAALLCLGEILSAQNSSSRFMTDGCALLSKAILATTPHSPLAKRAWRRLHQVIPQLEQRLVTFDYTQDRCDREAKWEDSRVGTYAKWLSDTQTQLVELQRSSHQRQVELVQEQSRLAEQTTTLQRELNETQRALLAAKEKAETLEDLQRNYAAVKTEGSMYKRRLTAQHAQELEALEKRLTEGSLNQLENQKAAFHEQLLSERQIHEKAIKSMEATVTTLQSDLSSLRAQLTNVEAEKSTIASNLEVLRSANAMSQSTFQATERQLTEELSRLKVQLEEERSGHTTAERNAGAERARLEAQLEEMQMEQLRRDAELEALLNSKRDASQQRTQVEEMTTFALDEAKKKLEVCEHKLKTVEQQYAEQRDASTKTVIHLTSLIREREADLQSLRAEKSKSESLCAQLLEKIEALENHQKKLEAELQVKDEHVVREQETARVLREELRNVEKSLSESRAKAEELAIVSAGRLGELEQLKATRIDEKDAIRNLQTLADGLEDRLTKKEEELTASALEVGNLRAETSAWKHRCEAAESKAQDAAKEATRFRLELLSATSNCEEAGALRRRLDATLARELEMGTQYAKLELEKARIEAESKTSLVQAVQANDYQLCVRIISCRPHELSMTLRTTISGRRPSRTSPLLEAIKLNRIDLAKLFLTSYSHHVDFEATDEDGQTALILAARFAREDAPLVALLCRYIKDPAKVRSGLVAPGGPDPEAVDKMGRNALHWAACNHNVDAPGRMCAYLRGYWVPVETKDKDGKIPYDIAKQESWADQTQQDSVVNAVALPTKS